jgi:hypothetical protein
LMSNTTCLNRIKSKDIQAKRKGNALVLHNDYTTYTMADVLPLPDYKVALPKGQFNSIHAHYNIRMEPDLGVGWAALHQVACGCGPYKNQLKRPLVPCSNITTQPRYMVNKDCALWPSYEGTKDWKTYALVLKKEVDKKVAWESLCCILNAVKASMSLMMHKGKVGAVSMTDKAAMGSYLVKWLNKWYTLQENTGGMSGMIPAMAMVVNVLYFNRVQREPLWYMPSGNAIS